MGDVFRALADPTRREILRLLRIRAMSAGEIADRLPLAKSTLSSHFNVLKNAGLIVSERQGTSIRYGISVSALQDALTGIMELLNVGEEEPSSAPGARKSRNSR